MLEVEQISRHLTCLEEGSYALFPHALIESGRERVVVRAQHVHFQEGDLPERKCLLTSQAFIKTEK